MVDSAPEVLFASTTPGLEPVLEGECKGLGIDATLTDGGVELRGEAGLHRRANLWLRTASRVLLRLGDFRARSPAELSRGLAKLSMKPYGGGVAALSVSSHRSRLREREVEQALSQIWPPAATGAELFVRLEEDHVTVSVDTSGELLYRRGYRQEVSRAPLRETLGAGMLLWAGYTGSEPLWDPMCGSGTLAIEAALIALRRPPGANRAFAFEKWPSLDGRAWAAEKAKAGGLSQPAQPIRATDANAGALGTARRNARRAGVFESLRLERMDATAAAPAPGAAPGLVIANLPFGKRVGDRAELVAFYRAFGAALKTRFPGWRAALLTEVGSLERELGLTGEVHLVDNGGLRCQLLITRTLAPRGPERI